MMATVDEVKAINAGLEIIGVLPTFASDQYNHHAEVIDTMRRAGWPVFDVFIPRSVKVAEAAAQGESITTWARGHAAAQAYRDLGEIVTTWQKQKARHRPA
jgi:chromosome partitioning protein